MSLCFMCKYNILVSNEVVRSQRWRRALPVPGNVCQVSKRGRHGRFVAQPNNSLSPIGMAVALLGKYFRYGNLVYSDSTLTLKTWVRPPMPSLSSIRA